MCTQPTKDNDCFKMQRMKGKELGVTSKTFDVGVINWLLSHHLACFQVRFVRQLCSYKIE
jgi:hypothetical protein